MPTDVQAEAIPLILGGGDVLMAAETGSGKTGAFCLPIIQTVWETLNDLRDGKSAKHPSKTATIPECTMSIYDRTDGLAVAPDGLRCQSRDQKEWHGCRTTTGVKGGPDFKMFFYEATVEDEGLCRLGWATGQADLKLGTCPNGFGFGGTGRKSTNNAFDPYGVTFGKNDVIGCGLDMSRSDFIEIRFFFNGADLGVAFYVPATFRNEPFYPALVLKNAEIRFNLGQAPFKYPPPPGYVSIIEAGNQKVPNPKAEPVVTGPAPAKQKSPQAIIIEPSRELAEQTLKQINKFKRFLRDPVISELLLVGGVNVKEQMQILQEGVDIVVATPGRLEDLIAGGYLSVKQCRFFVLDEADGLLKQNCGPMIDRVHKLIPKVTSDGCRLQMIVCSATLHSFEVKRLADRLMHFPTWVDLKGEDAVPETVHHVVVRIDPQQDLSWHNPRRPIKTDGVHYNDQVKPGKNTAETLSEAAKLLKGEYCLRAIEVHQMDRAIIFCRTKLDCDNLERFLKNADEKQYTCVCLHGDRSPNERTANLEAFKAKEARFLICTDVAARGLDITGLPFMINMTLPDEKSNYVHRIGRVGRAERMGLAISLVSTVPEKVWYHGEWCSNKGRNCFNTMLTNVKGCCIWYNEMNVSGGVEFW